MLQNSFKGLKFSTHENSISNYVVKPTERRQITNNEDRRLQKLLKRLTELYSPALTDVLRRQEAVQRYLIPGSLAIHGASLGQ